MARGKRPDSNQTSQYSHREQPSAHVLWDVPGTCLSDFGTPSARPRRRERCRSLFLLVPGALGLFSADATSALRRWPQNAWAAWPSPWPARASQRCSSHVALSETLRQSRASRPVPAKLRRPRGRAPPHDIDSNHNHGRCREARPRPHRLLRLRHTDAVPCVWPRPVGLRLRCSHLMIPAIHQQARSSTASTTSSRRAARCSSLLRPVLRAHRACVAPAHRVRPSPTDARRPRRGHRAEPPRCGRIAYARPELFSSLLTACAHAAGSPRVHRPRTQHRAAGRSPSRHVREDRVFHGDTARDRASQQARLQVRSPLRDRGQRAPPRVACSHFGIPTNQSSALYRLSATSASSSRLSTCSSSDTTSTFSPTASRARVP